MAPAMSLRLKEDTIAIDTATGKPTAITVPKNAIVNVVTPLNGNRVDVIWEGRTVSMFVEDIRDRGEAIEDRRRSRGA